MHVEVEDVVATLQADVNPRLLLKADAVLEGVFHKRNEQHGRNAPIGMQLSQVGDERDVRRNDSTQLL